MKYTVLLSVLMVLTLSFSQQDSIPEHETFQIHSSILKEDRTINVWLPKAHSNTQKLPVLYMLDGGIKEDFPHLANTLSKLMEKKSIPPMMLVGIENIKRRKDLTGYTTSKYDKTIADEVGGAENFRKFIVTELIPAIQKKYATTNSSSIIGESLAGLFILETFFLQPEVFDHYIAFDPSLWWNNYYYPKNLDAYLKDLPYPGKSLWFGASNTKTITQPNRKLAKTLKKKNCANLRWYYSDEVQEKHNTIFRAAKERALKWTFGKEQ